MALAEALSTRNVDLSRYAEPRLTRRERGLLATLFWAERLAAGPVTATQVAVRGNRDIEPTRRALRAATVRGWATRDTDHYSVAGRGRIALSLADLVPVECPRCDTPVLVADVAGGAVALDPCEVMVEHPCPALASAQYTGRNGEPMVAGHSRHCRRCGGTGLAGEPLPLQGVAVDPHGYGRWFTRRSGRRYAEAIYALHVCVA